MLVEERSERWIVRIFSLWGWR